MTDPLIHALEWMLELLKDPHPGLFTWNSQCIEAAARIRKELDIAEGKK